MFPDLFDFRFRGVSLIHNYYKVIMMDSTTVASHYKAHFVNLEFIQRAIRDLISVKLSGLILFNVNWKVSARNKAEFDLNLGYL